jgi:hypothetical protein
MSHVKPQIVSLTQVQQDVQQTQRIRPARDANNDPIAVLKQLVIVNCASDLVQDIKQ